MADLFEMLNPQAQSQPQGQGLPPGAPVEGPPASNEEMIARKSGWGQFFDTVRTNPGLQQAMMFMAAKMMQPLQQGETAGGNFGQGMFGASTLLGSGQDAERERQLKEQEAQRRNELVGAQTEQSRAHAGELRQRTAESAAKMPLEIKRLSAETGLREAQTRVESARAAGLEAQDPVAMAKLELELARWKVKHEQASTAAAGRANLREAKPSVFKEQMDALIEQQKYLHPGLTDEAYKAMAVSEWKKKDTVNEMAKKASVLSKLREDYANATLGLGKKEAKPSFRAFAEEQVGKEMADYLDIKNTDPGTAGPGGNKVYSLKDVEDLISKRQRTTQGTIGGPPARPQ